MVKPFEEIFPALATGGYQITSPIDNRFNCIAYAAGNQSIWWWPVPADVNEVFWPAGVAREETIDGFRAAFESIGFAVCPAEALERGYQKVALFADERGLPLHAARQLPNGRWTSKLGELHDIEHALRDLEGEAYGKVVLLMRRKILDHESG